MVDVIWAAAIVNGTPSDTINMFGPCPHAAALSLKISGIGGGTDIDMQLQVSNDNSNWYDLGSPQTVTNAATTAVWTEDVIAWDYMRIMPTVNAGSATAKVIARVKPYWLPVR